MEPRFFGSSERPLFGAYHPALAEQRDHGVVLAYPAPQEYMLTHYAFRLLCAQLEAAGLPTLRFDWSCTGDSAGDTSRATLAAWRDDLNTAIAELRDISGVSKVSVVGFRLGAAIAATTQLEAPLHTLVLWEPVVDGRAYLDELRAIERYKLGVELNAPEWWERGSPTELLGYALTPEQRREIAAIALAARPPLAAKTHLVTASVNASQRITIDCWFRAGALVSLDEVSDPSAARRDEGVMLSSRVLAHIVNVLITRGGKP